jgi:hypothetical protein
VHGLLLYNSFAVATEIDIKMAARALLSILRVKCPDPAKKGYKASLLSSNNPLPLLSATLLCTPFLTLFPLSPSHMSRASGGHSFGTRLLGFWEY